MKIDRTRRRLLTAPLLPLATAASALPIGASPTELAIERVRERIEQHYLSSIGGGNAEQFVRSQAANGSWTSIDYQDDSMGAWKPVEHLDRALAIAVAYKQPTSLLYRDERARVAVVGALRAWVERKPQSRNWWFNTIGPQLKLMPILVSMGDALPEPVRGQCLALLYDPHSVPADHATGQNLIWHATQQLVRGVLRLDTTDISLASTAMQGEAVIRPQEGIQPDFSFHQHGPQLYSGGYGLGFLNDTVRVAGWLDATPWAYSTSVLANLSDYVVFGLRPLIRGTWLDWGACGREFTRQTARRLPQRLVIPAAKQLARLAPDNANAINIMLRELEGQPLNTKGARNTHLWRSDFMVHQTARAYFSVKTMSKRTVGTECGNGENLLGYWLPFGVTYLLSRGDEYDDLPPVWDWSKLPGLTAPAEVPPFIGYQQHEESFVGGVSDGTSGMAAMVLNKFETKARKAWFFDGDLMVALGADISCTRPSAVATTLNQTKWAGSARTDQGELRTSDRPQRLRPIKWLWHDGLTYLFPEPATIMVQQGEVRNSGRRINDSLGGDEKTARVFTVWIDHERLPVNSSYAYGVRAGSDRAQAEQEVNFQVLSNTKFIQAVHYPLTGTTRAVFYEPGTLQLGGNLSLAVDKACLVLLKASGLDYQAHISEPTGLVTTIKIALKLAQRTIARAEVRLQTDWDSRGRSNLTKFVTVV